MLLMRRHNAHNIIENVYISSPQMFHIFLFMMVNKVKKLIVNKKIKKSNSLSLPFLLLICIILLGLVETKILLLR